MNSLRNFIASIETGEAGTPHIWLVVPGAIITGQVVSSEGFDKLLDMAIQPDEDGADTEFDQRIKRVAERAQELLANASASPDLPLDTIYMIKSVVSSGGTRMFVPFAQIALHTVAAWGMGEAKTEPG